MAMGVTPAAESIPGTEMTSISFRDQLWLSAYPLDRNLVFDYFALSPFYDRTCNNEQLRMESIHPLDMNHLSKRTGMEYILQDAQEPHLFVIRKQKCEGPEKVSAQAAYYVLDGSIYQAPHLYNVIGSRVVRSLYHITNAFAQASAKLEKIGNGTETENGKAGSEADADVQLKKSPTKVVDVKEVMRVDSILAGVMRKAPAASDVNQEQGGNRLQQEQASAKRLKVEIMKTALLRMELHVRDLTAYHHLPNSLNQETSGSISDQQGSAQVCPSLAHDVTAGIQLEEV